MTTRKLARALKRIRLAAGLTQRDLANQLDVGEMIVSRWERGEARPSRESRKKLAARFPTELGWLVPSQVAEVEPAAPSPAEVHHAHR